LQNTVICVAHKRLKEAAIFSARQHICYSALYAIAHPSVCLSVRLSHGWIKDGWRNTNSSKVHNISLCIIWTKLTITLEKVINLDVTVTITWDQIQCGTWHTAPTQ